MCSDAITTMVNDEVKSVKPASEFSDIVRHHNRSIYDGNGNKIGKQKVAVRFIKFTYINKQGDLVDNVEDAFVIFVEHCDENGRTLLNMKGRGGNHPIFNSSSK